MEQDRLSLLRKAGVAAGQTENEHWTATPQLRPAGHRYDHGRPGARRLPVLDAGRRHRDQRAVPDASRKGRTARTDVVSLRIPWTDVTMRLRKDVKKGTRLRSL